MKIQNFHNLFDAVLINVEECHHKLNESLNLNNISFNKLIIFTEYKSNIQLNFHNVNVNILVLKLDDYKLNIVNSEIKKTEKQ